MKYEARMANVDGIGKPSVIPIKSSNQTEAVAEFRKLQSAHGDSSVLKLSLFEINESGAEKEIIVS